MLNQKLRIRLKSFDYKLVFQSSKEIIGTAKRTGADVKGPVPLPRKVKKYTVNRSPHVDKESREQFEVRIYKCIIIIIPSAQTVEALRKLDLAAGVDVDIKLLGA